MNVELLKRVADVIVARPHDFQMRFVALDLNDDYQDEVMQPELSCGTACCIAGWALCLDRSCDLTAMNWHEPGYILLRRAARVLGIHAYPEAIFMRDDWPADYRDSYYAAKTDQERAQVAYERIHHYIATDGRE